MRTWAAARPFDLNDLFNLIEVEPESPGLGHEGQGRQRLRPVDPVACCRPSRRREYACPLVEPKSLSAQPAARGHFTDEKAVSSHGWSLNPAPRGRVKGLSPYRRVGSPPASRPPAGLDLGGVDARVFALDVMACPRCGGRPGVIATVQDPAVVRAILAHPGLAPNPIASSRPRTSPITPRHRVNRLPTLVLASRLHAQRERRTRQIRSAVVRRRDGVRKLRSGSGRCAVTADASGVDQQRGMTERERPSHEAD